MAHGAYGTTLGMSVWEEGEERDLVDEPLFQPPAGDGLGDPELDRGEDND